VRTGRTTGEVAEVVGVDERTVQRWLGWYRAGGLSAVTGRHARGRGAAPFLTVEQQTELADAVATGRFRTAAEVRRWVAERWGVSSTEGGLYALLGRLRCAPKVPRPVHEQADHLAQARWKNGGSRRALTQSA
jgi:transposase